MWRYLKGAFWAKADLPMVGPLPVNALALLGLGIFGCVEHALWLIAAGLETGYLYLLATNPRFQKVISAGDSMQTQKRAEDTRRELLAALSSAARARSEQQEAKVRQIMELPRGSAGENEDWLLASNLDPLQKLCALHLRLLSAEARLKADGTQEKEASLARQVDALEQELAVSGERFSSTLRESKQATLELTRKRLANAQKCRESVAELESDLVRIETQLDLALEDARLEGRPSALSGNLNLLNQILESNSALSNLDVSFSETTLYENN